jgi:hypothetical protein
MATDTTDGELGYVLDLLQPRCDERVQNCVALDPCTTAAYSPYMESDLRHLDRGLGHCDVSSPLPVVRLYGPRNTLGYVIRSKNVRGPYYVLRTSTHMPRCGAGHLPSIVAKYLYGCTVVEPYGTYSRTCTCSCIRVQSYLLLDLVATAVAVATVGTSNCHHVLKYVHYGCS